MSNSKTVFIEQNTGRPDCRYPRTGLMEERHRHSLFKSEKKKSNVKREDEVSMGREDKKNVLGED